LSERRDWRGKGIEPPAIEPSLPYDKIDLPDKVLNPGEDWTKIGTEEDPDFHKLYANVWVPAPPPATA